MSEGPPKPALSNAIAGAITRGEKEPTRRASAGERPPPVTTADAERKLSICLKQTFAKTIAEFELRPQLAQSVSISLELRLGESARLAADRSVTVLPGPGGPGAATESSGDGEGQDRAQRPGQLETKPLKRKAAQLIKTFLSFAYSPRVVIAVESTLP